MPGRSDPREGVTPRSGYSVRWGGSKYPLKTRVCFLSALAGMSAVFIDSTSAGIKLTESVERILNNSWSARERRMPRCRKLRRPHLFLKPARAPLFALKAKRALTGSGLNQARRPCLGDVAVTCAHCELFVVRAA